MVVIMQDTNTNQKILTIAREILASEGLGAVSFDAIARRLERSKQAVLYWYPTKRDLLAAMFLPWLNAEMEAAEDAVSVAMNRDQAVSSFVTAIAGFHLEDLDRFRMMYLVPQTTGQKPQGRASMVTGDEVYQVTNRLYGALAGHLDGDNETARKAAVAIHSAVLGLVMMFALTNALQDPLKHSETDLIEAMIACLIGKN
jgi:AcrR family transcriptional regulator